jgi:two-component system osmolarity sensor histidine kinase EnvZ
MIGWRTTPAFLGAQGIYAIGMAGSVVATLAITVALRSALHASEKNAAELMDAYMRGQQEIEQLDRSYRERLHDARSAATSVRCALEVLNQRKGRHRAEDRKIHRMLATELERMQSVLDPTATEPFADFDLADVIEPIVLANCTIGAPIGCDLPAIRVHGQRQATASVLDNLLRNAVLHAPGAQIQVRVKVERGLAAVIVEDDGPGIPPDECESVLLPGNRGSTAVAPGSGLGLHIAATMMTQQFGTLNVSRRHSRGTRVVFTLPIAWQHTDHLTPLHPLAS